MKSILTKARVPIKIWEDVYNVESAALDQLTNIANLPFVFKHVAAMPDVHLGKGATVGSVVATKNNIIPAAIGVDIGCGMMAIKLSLDPKMVEDKVDQLRKGIEEIIPVGFESNEKVFTKVRKWDGWKNFDTLCKAGQDVIQRAKSQLGTLGGGNHFIEFCKDNEGSFWIMLHSGSRNIGKTVAEYHIHEAKELMKLYSIHLVDRDLAYLPSDTPQFRSYINDLLWCQDYAKANREEMMRRILLLLQAEFKHFEVNFQVNCHHNYAEIENHFGENVWVTRKGAVRARETDYGIIPGSMGTRSYIVKGLGNKDSFNSCSHGAGRRMSRGEAKRTFTTEDLISQTEGVNCRKDEGVLDEIPGAYKDIDQVMANQSDLVEVLYTLKQFMCIKG